MINPLERLDRELKKRFAGLEEQGIDIGEITQSVMDTGGKGLTGRKFVAQVLERVNKLEKRTG